MGGGRVDGGERRVPSAARPAWRMSMCKYGDGSKGRDQGAVERGQKGGGMIGGKKEKRRKKSPTIQKRKAKKLLSQPMLPVFLRTLAHRQPRKLSKLLPR